MTSPTETHRFPTAESCEEAFYQAIEDADLDAMMAVWSARKTMSCIHPGAPMLTNLDDIKESWRQIFTMADSIRFKRYAHSVSAEGGLSIHHLREDVMLLDEVVNTVIVTNIFKQEEDGWKLILHHASAEPDLEEFEAEIEEANAAFSSLSPPSPTLH